VWIHGGNYNPPPRYVITTRSSVLRYARVCFIHTECNFYTQIVISTRTSVIITRPSVVLHAEYAFYTHESKFDTYACEYDTHKCDFYTLECFSNTQECDLNTHKINFYTHRAISTHTSVILTPTNVITTLRVWFIHAECDVHIQRLILHAECDFSTHECNFDTNECDYDTLGCDFHTHCDTHKSDFYTQSVTLTLTTVISTRKRLIFTRRKRFPHTRV
jgi:hypothetical protein